MAKKDVQQFNTEVITTLTGTFRAIYVPADIDFDWENDLGKAILMKKYDLNLDLIQTLDLLAKGLTYEEVAVSLHLQETKSVMDRIKKIKEKMNMNCKQACLEAARYGLGRTT